MRKLASIFFLIVLLFNLAGYSFLFQFLMAKADTQAVAQLDETLYNDNDLLEVKMPLNMPYITGSNSFERVDGQLEYGGVHYNYVKRKVSRDTVYILCLPNVSKTRLCKAKAAYGKEAADLPVNKKNSETVKKASLTTEYTCNKDPYKIGTISTATAINPEVVSAGLPHNLRSIPERPPQPSSC